MLIAGETETETPILTVNSNYEMREREGFVCDLKGCACERERGKVFGTWNLVLALG